MATPHLASLELSSAAFRDFLARSHDALFAHAEGTIIYVNDAFLRMMRAPSAATYIGSPVLDMVSLQDRPTIAARMLDGTRNREGGIATSTCIRADGTSVIVDYSTVRIGTEAPWTSIVTARDASERHALIETQARYRLLAQNLPNGAVLLFDKDLRYLLAEGDLLLESLGRRSSELVGKTLHELAAPAQLAQLEPHFRRALAGIPSRWEYTSGGRFLECRTTPVRDDAGNIVGGVLMTYETTEHKRLQLRFSESEARAIALIEHSGDLICSIDRDGKLTAFNSAYAKRVKERDGVDVRVGLSLLEFLPIAERAFALERHRRVLDGEIVKHEWTTLLEGKPSHWIVIETPMWSDGVTIGGVIAIKDITERRESELAVERKSRAIALLEAIASTANAAMTSDAAILRCLELIAEYADWQIGHAFIVVDGKLSTRKLWYASDKGRHARFMKDSESYQFEPNVELPGRAYATKKPVCMTGLPSSKDFLRADLARESELHSGVAFPILVGETVAGVVEFFSTRSESLDAALVAVLESVGAQLGRVIEREAHTQEVRALSLTDELTGLHNRRGLMVLTAQQLRIASRMTKSSALLFLDIDGLKRINDQFGHEAGDAVIRDFACVLRRSFRESDVLSRLGGDEFVVFMAAVGDEVGIAVARFENNVAAHNRAHPDRAAISASIGTVAIEPGGNATLDALLARADAVMYEAKRRRKGSASTAKA